MAGFDFSNHERNLALHAKGVPLPKATSTGTTIVGCLYDGGVVVCVPPPHSQVRPAHESYRLLQTLELRAVR